jgi:hypothetical protein
MTELTTNFQETVNNVLQEALNTESKKSSILLWKNHNPKLPNSFILKDREGKRYIGLSRTDRKGEIYWSFKEISRKRKSENNQEYANNSNSSE